MIHGRSDAVSQNLATQYPQSTAAHICGTLQFKEAQTKQQQQQQQQQQQPRPQGQRPASSFALVGPTSRAKHEEESYPPKLSSFFPQPPPTKKNNNQRPRENSNNRSCCTVPQGLQPLCPLRPLTKLAQAQVMVLETAGRQKAQRLQELQPPGLHSARAGYGNFVEPQSSNQVSKGQS